MQNTMLLDKAYDTENFRKEGHKLIDKLADYLQSAYAGKGLDVLPSLNPQELEDKYSKYNPESFEELIAEVIDDSNHLHHPGYIGHQVVPPLPEAALAGLVSDLLNNGMAIYEMGPSGTAMEKYVIKWMSNHIGMPDTADGVITSGGSLGNLTAMLAARQSKADYDIWSGGNRDSKYAIFVSEHAHYCIDRAVKVMGLGDKTIFKVACDESFKLDIDNLIIRYDEAVARGYTPIAVVGVAGSTGTGTYDPLDSIADFCEENDLWFHIDAAHGGAAALSDKHKFLCRGMERADSVVIDFHKMMLVPALATAVLFKNKSSSYSTFAQKAEYLLYDVDKKDYDLAARTMECTKRMISLKIYTLIKLYGKKLFEEYIEKTSELATEFAAKVEESKGFLLAAKPESNIVCFRYTAGLDNEDEIDELNLAIRERIIEEGKYYIVYTKINERVYLRITIMNIYSADKLDDLLEEVRKVSISIS